MIKPRLLGILLASATALCAVPIVLAAVEDRVVVRNVGGSQAAAYSPSLAVVTSAPADYARGCCYGADGGQWLGPPATADGQAASESTIDWKVKIVAGQRDVRAAVVGSLTQSWSVIDSGDRQIEHRIGGRLVGTIPAVWLQTRANRATDDAGVESAIGFSICGNIAVAEFQALKPAANSAGLVKGSLPSQWNAAQTLAAVAGVRLEGTLPVDRIDAGAGGRRLSGTVRDCHNHAVPATKVTLEQLVGGRWRPVASGRTTASGSFAFNTHRSGSFRAAAGGKRSAALRIF